MTLRPIALLALLLLTACGGGGIDGARVGVPDVLPQAQVAADPLYGRVSEDVERPEDGGRVVLDARASVAVRYRWSLQSAPEGARALAWRIHDPDAPVTTFSANRPGTYRLRLTVENRSGRRASRSVGVILEAADGGARQLPPVPANDKDGDGRPDPLDLDSDGDGTADALDAAPLDPAESAWPRQTETETLPGADDRPADAQDLGAWAEPGLEILGALATADDTDFYRLDLPTGRYALALLAKGPLPQVNLLDPEEAPQPLEALPVPAGRLYTFALAADGARLLAVSGEAAAGYTLLLYADDDLDGLGDALERALGSHPGLPDSDGDGLPDGGEALPVLDGRAAIDADGDGRPPWLDPDSDGDGLPDGEEGLDDGDGDGLPDAQDSDADGNGLPDGEEAGPDLLTEGPVDSDRDGLPDYRDEDDDGDGLPDRHEPPQGRLQRAAPWDPGPGLGGAPRLDRLLAPPAPPGHCRVGETLTLSGARLPSEGTAWVVLDGPGGLHALAPETRSAAAWTLACPDLPPGRYRLRPFHEGRVGPALDLHIHAADAPVLESLEAEIDPACGPQATGQATRPFRLRLTATGLSHPFALTLPKPAADHPGVSVSKLHPDDADPCLPAAAVDGPAILHTLDGDSPPLWFRAPPRENFVRLSADAPVLADGGAGAVIPMDPDALALVPLSRGETLALLWDPADTRLRGADLVPEGEDQPVLETMDRGEGASAAVRALLRLALGACWSEAGWEALAAEDSVRDLEAYLQAQGGLDLPLGGEAAERLAAALADAARLVPCPQPQGALRAFVGRYQGRLVLAAENGSGLPVTLAYRDERGRWLIPPADGPRPDTPGWLPPPPARVIPGVDGQSGEARLLTPGSGRPPADSGVDARAWRWAWLRAAAQALRPAWGAAFPGDADDLAQAWPAQAEEALDEALARAWAGDARGALGGLVEALARTAREGGLDPLIERPEALPQARARLALALDLAALALAADAGPLARLARALEDTPPLQQARLRFPPALLGVQPPALRAGAGDQLLTLAGQGLRALSRDTLGYPSRRAPWAEVERDGARWRLAPVSLADDQTRLRLRLPAFLLEAPGDLGLTLHQPRPQGGEAVLGPVTVAVRSVPLIQAVSPAQPVPGGELLVAGGAFAPRPADHRVLLVDAAGVEHPLAVTAADAAGLRARLPAHLAPGEYRLRVQVKDGEGGWLDGEFPEAVEDPGRLSVRPGNVVFRLCDAGSVADDAFALYLDGVFQGEYRAGDGLPYREFAFELSPGSSHRLGLVLSDPGADAQGTYGLDLIAGAALFGGDLVSGAIVPGERKTWTFRVAGTPDEARFPARLCGS